METSSELFGIIVKRTSIPYLFYSKRKNMKTITVLVGFLIALSLVAFGFYRDIISPYVNNNGFYVGGVFVFLLAAGYANYNEK